MSSAGQIVGGVVGPEVQRRVLDPTQVEVVRQGGVAVIGAIALTYF